MRRVASAGVRWNDPAFGIEWPIEPVSWRRATRAYPLLDQRRRLLERQTGACW
jgi:dTDP-4-dehydrorhamnose 3,5-epimerase-like enzyme